MECPMVDFSSGLVSLYVMATKTSRKIGCLKPPRGRRRRGEKTASFLCKDRKNRGVMKRKLLGWVRTLVGEFYWFLGCRAMTPERISIEELCRRHPELQLPE